MIDKPLLLQRKTDMFEAPDRPVRDGIELEKGVALTEDYLLSVKSYLEDVLGTFVAYPDLYLDTIKSEISPELFFYQRIFLRSIMRFKEVYVVACLKGDTPILTQRGLVPIKDFNPNDKVWSDGEWREVENLNKKEWNGDLVRISADHSFGRDIVVTDDHLFLVCEQDHVLFKKARDFRPGDELLSSISLPICDQIALEFESSLQTCVLLNEEFYELLGIWLGCGAYSKDGLCFRLNDERPYILDSVVILMDKVFQINTYCLTDNYIVFTCPEVNAFWKNLVGRAKRIPFNLMECEPYKQLQIVKGFFGARGICNNGTYTVKLSTLLCEQLKQILFRNFINVQVRAVDDFYLLSLPNLISQDLQEAFLNEQPFKPYLNHRGYYDIPLIDGNRLYMKNMVTNVELLPPDGEDVYCLQMENEVFNINGVEGHNCRAFSKSFISILAMFLQCMFIPGTRRFICAPAKKQGAEIAKEKLTEIFSKWPLLRKEVVGGDIEETPGNYGKDYVLLKFRNGSTFEVSGALESTRGQRKHGGLIDEVRDHDEGPISEIVLPLLNVSRRMANNQVNPKEPNQQTIFATSAGSKSSFAYDKLISVFENSIINPETSFSFGCDYRVPMMHGLIDKKFVNNLKMDPSFNEASFAKEYLSIWDGASEDSWFNFSKLEAHRKIKNPEFHEKNRAGSNQFYFISVDVARLQGCQSVACVFRVNIVQDRYYATLVNIVVLGKVLELKTFTQQAIELKKLIRDYNPREVLIDCNGLGLGLADEMIKEHYDEYGEYLPAYGFFNNDDYKKTQPKDAKCILYSMKANGPLNSQINGTTFARINGGMIQFLISEQDAKVRLLATKVGQKMSAEQRIKRLMPHELTTSLFTEMGNLRLKRTGSGTDIVLEQINTRFPKDKYSAFSYGVWRIKEMEEAALKKQRRREGGKKRKLTFYTGGR